MSKHLVEVVDYLLNSNTVVTSKKLSEYLGISSKTLLNRINDYNYLLIKYGFQIKRKPRVGIWITSEEDADYERLKAVFGSEIHPIFDSPDERIDSMILNLLFSNKYMSVQEFAENLYVSESTIGNDLIQIRHELSNHNLTLDNKRGFGYSVKGQESEIRKYFTTKFKTKSWIEIFEMETQFEFNSIKEVIQDILLTNKYYLPDLSINSFCAHLFITLIRLNHDNYQEFHVEHISQFDEQVEKIIQEIVGHMKLYFNIELPESEQLVLKIQLSIKQVLGRGNQEAISDEMNILIKKMLTLIYKSLHIDLREDQELIQNLYLHLVPLKYRLLYQIQVDNPLINQIKKENPFGFIVAKEAGKVIGEQYKQTLSESEIAFLALHFSLSIYNISNMLLKNNLSRIVIVCGSGVGSARMLEYLVNKNFKDYICDTTTIDLSGLSTVNLVDYDYIFSTVPINQNLPIPIINVNSFLSEEDIQKISSYLKKEELNHSVRHYFSEELYLTNITELTFDKVISYMVDKISKVKNVEDSLYDSIMERENLFTTEIGNLAAIPHPMVPQTQKSFVSIGILDNPIYWKDKEVQFIIMFLIGEDETHQIQSFYHFMSELLIDNDLIKDLIDNPSYHYFLRKLKI